MIRFDVDTGDIEKLRMELGATREQVRLATSRALSRTAMTLRRIAQKELKSGLDLRRASALRARLRNLKFGRKGRDADAIVIWFGLNDLRVSDFKASKGALSQTKEGAMFKGHLYKGAFVGKGKQGRRTVFRRKGTARFPIHEETYGIYDDAMEILEDRVYPDTVEIFMRHFASDLRSRVAGFVP